MQAAADELWTSMLTDKSLRIGNFCGNCSATFARWYAAQSIGRQGPVRGRMRHA